MATCFRFSLHVRTNQTLRWCCAKLPTVYFERGFALSFGLIANGLDQIDPFRRAPKYEVSACLTASCQLVTCQSCIKLRIQGTSSKGLVEARRQVRREKFIGAARLTSSPPPTRAIGRSTALNFSVQGVTSCRVPVTDTRASGKDIIGVYKHILAARDGSIEVLTREIH